MPSSLLPSAATSLPSTVPDTAMLPVTVRAPVAAVPVVDMFCAPNNGVTFVPAIPAVVLRSALVIVPSAIFADVHAVSAIFVVVTAELAISAVTTASAFIN